jgi:mRNA interferase RelE/StbE
MTQWKIELDEIAKKELKKLDRQAQSLITNFLYTRILNLDHPKQSGKALTGNKKGHWRYRVDKFRIICKLEEDKLVILIIKIAKRDVVYED